MYFLGGWILSLAVVAAVLAGVALFPILLPWLPTHNFSSKGFIIGGLVALPFALSAFLVHPAWTWWQQVGAALGILLAMPAVSAFIALNFTGSSTFTSRTGVKREMYRYIPSHGLDLWVWHSSYYWFCSACILSVVGGLLFDAYIENTLVYDAQLCNGCAMCVAVCPHAVFEMDGRLAVLVQPAGTAWNAAPAS